MSDRDHHVRCQRCGKPSNAWRNGSGRSLHCPTCRVPPPASPAEALAANLHPVISKWLQASYSHIALASGGGIVLREVGFSGSYRVAEFDTEEAAVLAIESGIPWREVAPREPLTRNTEAVAAGVDGMHLVSPY